MNLMKQNAKYAMTALCAAMALPLVAITFTSPKTAPVKEGLMERTQQPRTFAAEGRKSAPARVQLLGAYDPDELGTPVEVMYEDFSLITGGAFGDPVEEHMNRPQNDPEYTYPWTNMKPGFCHLDGWGCDENTLSAGGMVCLDAVGGQAHINTCMLDVSASKLSLLEFKVFAPEASTETTLFVEAAETFNMSPTWDIMEPARIDVPQGDWHEVRVAFFGGGQYTLYNIVLMSEGTQAYIDDVRVSTIDPFVGTPEIRRHDEYQGTSFRANWSAVEGAEKYLVNVYERAYGGYVGDVVQENLEATENHLTITDLESGTPYFIEVRAVKGEHIGYPSAPELIWDVEKPVLNTSTGIEGWDYTASWGEVPKGDVYNYWAYGKRVADHDGTFTITKESYDQLTDHEGNRLDWTHEDNPAQTYDEYTVMGGVNQAGWRAKHSAPFHDYLCIDGWWYVTAHEDAGLLSPEMDLAYNGGKATLSLTMASEFLPAAWNEYGIDLQVQCAVAVFAWDDAKEDYSQVFITYPGEVSLSWKKFTCELEGLTDRCVIGIYAVKAPGNLYIRNIELTQERKAGDTFMDPFLLARYHDGTEIDVHVSPYVSGTEVYHKVGATAGIVESNGWSEYLVKQDGGYSDLEYVGRTEWTDAVTEIGAAESKVKVEGADVTIDNPEGLKASLVTASGLTICESASKQISFTLPAHGIYMLRIGRETVKIAY